jgi:hypothetical protein
MPLARLKRAIWAIERLQTYAVYCTAILSFHKLGCTTSYTSYLTISPHASDTRASFWARSKRKVTEVWQSHTFARHLAGIVEAMKLTRVLISVLDRLLHVRFWNCRTCFVHKKDAWRRELMLALHCVFHMLSGERNISVCPSFRAKLTAEIFVHYDETSRQLVIQFGF